MIDALAIGIKFMGEFLGGVDAIFGTIILYKDPNRCSIAFKAYFSFHYFGPGESDLVHHKDLDTGGIS